MKAGEIVTFAHGADVTVPRIAKHRALERFAAVAGFMHYGTHSSEEYGKSDATEPVVNGCAEYVVVCKVIAVVRRGVTVDE